LLDRLVDETGGHDVSFLETLSAEEAMDWLTSVPGIGPKTAAVQLCFRFGMPVFAVDTHCHRLAQRFGLVDHGATRRAAHRRLNEIVPDELCYSLHRLLITHGRAVCTARDPNCASSPTCREYCTYYEQVIEGGIDPGAYPVDA
jgi:endonuclease-3